MNDASDVACAWNETESAIEKTEIAIETSFAVNHYGTKNGFVDWA